MSLGCGTRGLQLHSDRLYRMKAVAAPAPAVSAGQRRVEDGIECDVRAPVGLRGFGFVRLGARMQCVNNGSVETPAETRSMRSTAIAWELRTLVDGPAPTRCST